ncbi:MAG: ornithine cyclodeaminase family protein [Lachnospiraceae bacterium]|nr:ornithine cyclodeaminase family protein [Lachnospiraceae bacterium]
MKEPVKIISDSLVKENITIEEVIEQVENTWRWYGEGKVIMPSKITLDMNELGVHGWFNSMPSYIQDTDLAGLKFVGGFIDNRKIGLPFIRAKVFLCDPRTGSMKALMGGDWISQFRTGAQPAIACKYLAAKTDIVTIIGAGAQAYAALECMRRTLPLKEVRICDIFPEARKNFIAKFPGVPFELKDCDSIEDACPGSDVIITLTTADAPLVRDAWVGEGALLLTMGSYTETDEEIVLHCDRLLTDHIGQTLHRGNLYEPAKKGLVNEDSFSATLPEVIAGKKAGRTDPKERILCQLVGMGAPDAAVAALVLQHIEENGVEVPEVDLA